MSDDHVICDITVADLQDAFDRGQKMLRVALDDEGRARRWAKAWKQKAKYYERLYERGWDERLREHDELRGRAARLQARVAELEGALKDMIDTTECYGYGCGEGGVTCDRCTGRATLKGQVTKIKRRVGRGICPCCNRTFKDLGNHMESKHPDWSEE